mmetsp:Transcript_31722/g.73620  ORF Transcript_31722/g.73620 Transcript_31722/m.73620 type:complete len:273 (-) Transcript_31722:186-1004(-)
MRGRWVGFHGPQRVLVHGGGVVGLAGVFHEKLPIAIHGVFAPANSDHVHGHTIYPEPGCHASRQVAQRLQKWPCLLTHTHKDKTMEFFEAHWCKAHKLLLKSLNLVHAWGPLQRTVVVVGPSMVRAHQTHFGPLANGALQNFGATVATDVGKSVQLAIGPSAHGHWTTPLSVHGQVAPWLHDLVCAPNQTPGRQKDALAFPCEPSPGVVALCRQRGRLEQGTLRRAEALGVKEPSLTVIEEMPRVAPSRWGRPPARFNCQVFNILVAVVTAR